MNIFLAGKQKGRIDHKLPELRLATEKTITRIISWTAMITSKGGRMEQKDRDYILRLFPAVVKIKDGDIREKVIQTWLNSWKRSNFLRIEDVHQFEPARDRIPYTNVDHTNQVCQACERMATIPAEILSLKLNPDYLLAGALLHDVDKMVIFDAQTGGWTEAGRRTSHALAGAAMARAEGPFLRNQKVPPRQDSSSGTAGLQWRFLNQLKRWGEKFILTLFPNFLRIHTLSDLSSRTHPNREIASSRRLHDHGISPKGKDAKTGSRLYFEAIPYY